MHEVIYCSKYSESTVGIVTDVKPVFFAVNIFAVYAKYERLSDLSDSSHNSCQIYYCARPPSDGCRTTSPQVMSTSYWQTYYAYPWRTERRN